MLAALLLDLRVIVMGEDLRMLSTAVFGAVEMMYPFRYGRDGGKGRSGRRVAAHVELYHVAVEKSAPRHVALA